MKKPAIWISVIIIGVAGLIFASQFMAPEPVEFLEENQELVEATTTVEPNNTEADTKTPAEAIPEGWQKIENDNFSINTPKTWSSSVPKNSDDSVEKFKTVTKLKSGVSDDVYIDPDIVVLNINYLEKGEKTFEEIVGEFALNEEQAAMQVEFMREAATPPYNEITTEDILVTREQVELKNGTVTEKITYQCLKICYIEGSAYTTVQYFIEGEGMVYKLEAKTGTTEKTETLLLVAEQVVKTFETK